MEMQPNNNNNNFEPIENAEIIHYIPTVTEDDETRQLRGTIAALRTDIENKIAEKEGLRQEKINLQNTNNNLDLQIENLNKANIIKSNRKNRLADDDFLRFYENDVWEEDYNIRDNIKKETEELVKLIHNEIENSNVEKYLLDVDNIYIQKIEDRIVEKFNKVIEKIDSYMRKLRNQNNN